MRGYTSWVLTPADWLSLVRVPLGVAFVPLAGRPTLALLVLGLAGISDMLDGWLARRKPHPNSWGPWLDPLCDKVFITLVLIGLYLSQAPSLSTTLALLTREAAILLLFIVRFLMPSTRGMRYDYHAHAVGKANTVAQFLTVAALLLHRPEARIFAAACAVLGLLCAVTYGRRGHALANAQRPRHGGSP
jgi:cardiolipin synthase